jgi:hypothetical protein
MIRRGAAAHAVLCALLLTSACALIPIAQADPECRFPSGTPLAFTGQASLGQLDLDAPGRDANRVGTVYVTSERINLPRRGPTAVGADGQPLPSLEPARAFCAVYREGPGHLRGATGPVPDDWAPPNGLGRS